MGAIAGPAEDTSAKAAALQAGREVRRDVRVANREMTLVVRAPAGNALSTISMVTLLFGLAVASLLMLVSRLLTRQALEDQRSLNWFAEQNSIRNSLTRELNHRVKNTLANVLSIISLTRRRSENLDDFAEALDGRIRALSATHDLLTQSEWGTTPIRAVVEAELAPYVRSSDQPLVLSGPDVVLAPNDALSLGLALHELATNSVKHGSLGVEDGIVELSWNEPSDGALRMIWRETGGPQVVVPSRKSGSGIVQKLIAASGGELDFDWNRDGLIVTLTMPTNG